MMCASRTFSTRYHHYHYHSCLHHHHADGCHNKNFSFQTVKLEEMEKKAGNAEGEVSALRSRLILLQVDDADIDGDIDDDG